MSANDDPRIAELMRRRAAKNGTLDPPTQTVSGPPSPESGPDVRHGLDDESRSRLREMAAEHPGWSASDLADAFEGEYGWRPTGQAVGRAISRILHGPPKVAPALPPATDVPTPQPSPDVPTWFWPDTGARDLEVEAIGAVVRALGSLSPGAVRRVLEWARSRFEEGVKP